MGIIAVTLASGCLRFGYGPQEEPTARSHDAGPDAAAGDAAAPRDAGKLDAAQLDAAQLDAAAAPMDAAVIPQDSGMDAAVGGEPPDVGIADAGAVDAGATDARMPDPGATDSGMIDAPIDGAAMDAGTTDPCIGRTDLLFCGGFDDSAEWGSSLASNGTAITTTERAHSGSSSLHASTSAAGSGSKIARREAAISAQAGRHVWARAFFYMPSSTVIDAASRLAIMRLSEAQPPYVGCSVVIRSEYVELGGVTTRYRALSPFPRDLWTCVELHVEIDDNSDGACNAYVDGVQAAQAQDADTLPESGYTALSVGLEYTNAAQGQVDLYIDDVAASNTRVGCD